VIVCDYQLSRGATGVDAIERLRSAFPISSTSPIPARVISGDASSPLCEVGSRVVQAGESGEVSRGAGRRLRAATVGSGNPTDGRQELAAGIGPASAPGSPYTSKFAGHSARMANRMARLEGVASGWPGIEIMNPKFMWSRPPRITAPQEPGAKLVIGARRKGRPPLGGQAMSGAERARRYRQRLAELGKPSKASEK